MSRRGAIHCLLCILAAAASAGCAARRFTLPVDTGAPLPSFADVYAGATAACGGVRTFTAELALAGRAGADRLRGRVVAGFARPDSMRLEGVAPLGPPAFVLAATGGRATLLLPRDNAVLRGAPDDVLEALTGVSLQPSDLQAVLTGCGTDDVRAQAGRLHANGWASVTMADGSTLYLQQMDGAWRVRAAQSGEWTIEYPAWQGRFPAQVRLRRDAASVPVDLTASVSQLEANVDVDAAAFAVVVPDSARVIAIDDLRAAGPLRGAP